MGKSPFWMIIGNCWDLEECFPQKEPNWTGKPVRTKVDLGRKVGQLVHVASLASKTLPSETT